MATVLVVDDQASNRYLLATVVGSAGHRVLEADGGETALEVAGREHPDLIISDILMPGVDGYEFVRRLRSDPELRDTRVVFYTATYLEDEVRQLAAGCGVEHFLFKPCEPQQILTVVRDALGFGATATGAVVPASFDREHMRLVNDKLIRKIDELEELNERHEQLNAKLHASEALHRVLFECNPQPMLAFDRGTFETVAVNDALIAGYGYSRAELMSMTIKDLRPPEDVAPFVEAAAVDPTQARTEHVEVSPGRPWRHRYKDGTIVEVLIASSDATVAGRECRIASFQNVTEGNRVAAELAAAHDEAVEASNLKSAFLHNMSHEIRTPMNGVIALNQLLLDGRLDDKQRSYAEHVATCADQMMVIIDDILDISRIETGQLELDLREFRLRDVVESACAVAAAEAQAKGLAHELHIDEDLPDLIRGDEQRFRQILLNLVFNAVKFTAVGSVVVRASGRRSPDGARTVRIEVTDTGIGIEPAILDRMFEPFTQADVSNTRTYGGNGLGLAIARELVVLMAGTMGATSESGAGSTFWFELDVDARAAGGQARRPETTEIAAVHLGPDAPLVLVAEDTPVNQIVAARLLERCGCRSQVVGNGREVLHALATQQYDAILMDCQMPELDGYATTRELRRREEGTQRTPVIAMTAHAMTGDRAKCLAAGMDDYLAKPMRHQLLANALWRWIPATRAADRLAGASTS
jgi:PAS domain S-box-containing protein